MIIDDSNLKMTKVTFMVPHSLMVYARRYASETDRDLSSVCRIALKRLVAPGGAKISSRSVGRPRRRGPAPLKVL